MGMTADQNEAVSFEEQQEIKKREAEAAAKIASEPQYTAIGRYTYKKKDYLLLVGEDKKWYKSEYLHDTDEYDINHSPQHPVFSKEITPVTEKEFYTWFPKA